ncbi:MAG: hypothetical protein ACREP4_06555 [Stenotrophomonas sp.]|uniref:hypothetical protein n=1 Tax=Stenotrophomonas sp. TaxID=69392 RepID=UPI003D6D64E6
MSNDANVTAAALRDAAVIADEMTNMGVTVLGSYSNGRRIVLVVDTPPVFVRGVMRRSSPNGVGTDRVMAAPYKGAQLEWIERDGPSELQLAEVAHG